MTVVSSMAYGVLGLMGDTARRHGQTFRGDIRRIKIAS